MLTAILVCPFNVPTSSPHRGLTQNFSARISTATAMWEEYAGPGQPPHVVSVASALWDVARLWLHERQQLEGQALGKPLLEGWVANFSAVVAYSKQTLPQVREKGGGRVCVWGGG